MIRNDPLTPSLPLLMKLGSIVVHADEAHSPSGHEFDITAMKQLIGDPEVQTWLRAMSAFLPVKRIK